MLTAPSPSSQRTAAAPCWPAGEPAGRAGPPLGGDDAGGEPGGERELAADDAPAAVVAAAHVEQVHGAAAPMRAAVPPPEQLRHDRLRRDPAREREAVAAVARDEQVGLVHGAHGADARRLLARREMAVAADLRGLVLALGLRLEDADEQHLL